MFRRLFLLLALLGCAFAATAGKGPGAVRKEIESSMHVTGNIDITAEGKVVGYRLDHPEKLPKGIVDMVDRIVPRWTFEPVALPAGTVGRSNMNLMFVAKKLENGSFSVTLRDAGFSSDNIGEKVTVATQTRRIAYPISLSRYGVAGTVYLKLKIDRSGKVVNIDAEHVNLRVVGAEPDMNRWRRALANACISAVETWTFNGPTSGPEADGGFWYGTLPIDFSFEDDAQPKYGQWQTYVAGPRKIIPWLDETLIAGSDAITANSFHRSGEGRRLLTPLDGG